MRTTDNVNPPPCCSQSPVVAAQPDAPPPMKIAGYLMRQSREGKWKRRYYETVTENGWWMLVYYKTSAREKILNAVKMHRTNRVELLPKEEYGGGCFGIEMDSEQVYVHKTANEAEARKWVDALNQCRTAALAKKKKSKGRDSILETPMYGGAISMKIRESLGTSEAADGGRPSDVAEPTDDIRASESQPLSQVNENESEPVEESKTAPLEEVALN